MPQQGPITAEALSRTSILLDCRWLGMGGAGRITEHLLRELRESPPPGHWILWGPAEKVDRLSWSTATTRDYAGDPRALFGQRDLPRVPRCDVAVYLHQIRPLRPLRAITFILDTIPLRHGGHRPARLAKRLYFLLVAQLSSHILTISDFSRASIMRDRRVDEDRVSTVRLPVDQRRAQKIARLRKEIPAHEILLYVGRFDRHKNLKRLCRAFAESEFGKKGRLQLVGGWDQETEALRSWVDIEGIRSIDIQPACDEKDLDRLLASSRALVMPSLEEGYGLPAFEAAAAGIPVAASRTGAMQELPPEAAVLFDPENEADIRKAVDEVTARGGGHPYVHQTASLRDVLLDAVAATLPPAPR
jgi:glycosyltransferase involved in cell wall biosynthesis